MFRNAIPTTVLPPLRSTTFYAPALDGLRFCAFLLVFLAHQPFTPDNTRLLGILNYGKQGVDLFFLLSAYLLTKLLYAEWQQQGHIKLSYFYIRRALRILPLYYGYLALIFLLHIHTDWSTALHQLKVIGLLTLSDNYMRAFTGGHYLKYAIHLWTISWEIQFYAVLPLFVYLAIKITPGMRLAFCLLLASYALWERYCLLPEDYVHIFMFPHRRPEAVLAGIFLALPAAWPKVFVDVAWIIWALCCVAFAFMIVTARIEHTGDVRILFIFPVCAVFFGGLVIGVQQWKVIGKLLGCRVMRFLGTISYGLYMYHILGFFIIIAIAPPLQPALLIVLTLCLTVSMASISYYVFERRFLRFKAYYTIINSRAA